MYSHSLVLLKKNLMLFSDNHQSALVYYLRIFLRCSLTFNFEKRRNCDQFWVLLGSGHQSITHELRSQLRTFGEKKCVIYIRSENEIAYKRNEVLACCCCCSEQQQSNTLTGSCLLCCNSFDLLQKRKLSTYGLCLTRENLFCDENCIQVCFVPFSGYKNG